ncbi:MAG: PAS domain S-box protein [Kofleriaceae bacterium]
MHIKTVTDDQFRLLVDSIQDYAIYLMAPDGTIESWNSGAQRLKGYGPEEAIGKNFSLLFTEDDRVAGKPKRLLAAALANGRNQDTGWRTRKDGTQFWADALITALFDQDGKHVGFAKVTRDLTDLGYRAFVTASHSIVFTTDSIGRANADSPSWREHTGQSEAEWRTGKGWEVVHPDDREHVREAWSESCRTGQQLDCEFRLRKAAGNYSWMASRAISFRDREGNVREWFGVLSDISARKQAELERENALELLRTTLRSIGDAVLATDSTGKVTFMNSIAERLTGWTLSEAQGQDVHTIFPIFNEESGEPVENPIDKVLERGVIVGLANHTVLRRRDGVLTPIADSAAPIRGSADEIHGVVLVFRDVSDEKKTFNRRMLLASATEEIATATDYRDALRRIAKLTCPRLADWVAVDVLEGGRIEQIALAHQDPAMVQLAKQWNEIYPLDPDGSSGVYHAIRTGHSQLYTEIPNGLFEKNAVSAEHLRLIQKLDLQSGMVIPLRGRRDVFGAITFACVGPHRRFTEEDLALAETLAERVSTLVERRRLEEEAELANRQKDEFLATISHELRTPLQAILGYATMLERNTVPDSSKAIAVIVRNAQAQARLVEDMLDMSRILSGKFFLEQDSLEIGPVIEAALDAIRPAAMGRQVELSSDLPADLGKVIGDAGRLQQVFGNIANNAVKFTPRGGKVRVTARRTGAHVEIAIRDNGQGMSKEHLTVIFERFRQVDSSSTRKHGGLGLGLAIVRHIVAAHGGAVSAESAGLGKGSLFTVKLPAALDSDELIVSATKDSFFGASILAGKDVILVDDDDDVRQSIADLLETVGARVRQASTAASALTLVEERVPDVLITDIGMPVEDGYSLLWKVRSRSPQHGGHVPMVALTAFVSKADISKVNASGFDAHIAKPATIENIAGALLQVLNRSRH